MDNPLAPKDGEQEEIDSQAPVDNTAQTDQQPVADTTSSTDDQIEDDEWADAADAVFPGLKSANNKDKKDEQEQPSKTGEEQKTPAADKAGEDTNDGANPPKGESDEADKDGEGADEAGEEDEEIDTSARDARVAQREYAEQLEDIKSDITATLFPNRKTELEDGDGDPIRTVEDVMKLINPATIGSETDPQGRAFTHDEAGLWLLQNSSALNKQIAADDKEIERISTLQLDIKDQADSIREKYGPLLEADPELKNQLWADFIAECETKAGKAPDGSDTNIIVRTPKIGLERFYARALEPLAVVGRQLEQSEAEKQAALDKSKETQEQQRRQQRQDRGDIYGGGSIDTRDDESKEWDEAAKAVFSPQELSRLRK